MAPHQIFTAFFSVVALLLFAPQIFSPKDVVYGSLLIIQEVPQILGRNIKGALKQFKLYTMYTTKTVANMFYLIIRAGYCKILLNS